MLFIILVSILTIIALILSIVFLPTIKIFGKTISTYYIVTLFGALLIISFGGLDYKDLFASLTKDSAINPLKIIVLFISMTILSIFLDEIGFFRYLAFRIISLVKGKQIHLFLTFYLIISIFTMFSSNDIVILTFTPFICYLAKNLKINPIPYLVSEFIAANTWSMMFIIGNPTNIYLAGSFDITFLEYFFVMGVPTLLTGIFSLFLMILVFRRSLSSSITISVEEEAKPNTLLLIVGLLHLGLCTVLLVASNYIHFEMWLISFAFLLSLTILLNIYSINKKDFSILGKCYRKAPYAIIPFLLSMFVICYGLDSVNVCKNLEEVMQSFDPVFGYGIASFLSANILNNIPMSVFFTNILSYSENAILSKSVYATIVGSNLGAILSPLGALAGIMWMSILKKNEVKYNFFDFFRYGILVGLPSILTCLIVLRLIP